MSQLDVSFQQIVTVVGAICGPLVLAIIALFGMQRANQSETKTELKAIKAQHSKCQEDLWHSNLHRAKMEGQMSELRQMVQISIADSVSRAVIDAIKKN